MAFIDWDQAHVGDPLVDLAYAAWQFLDLGGPEVQADPDRAGQRFRLLADAYGCSAAERHRLVDLALECMDLCWRGIRQRAAAGNADMQRLVDAGAADDVQAGHAWSQAHRDVFDAPLA